MKLQQIQHANNASASESVIMLRIRSNCFYLQGSTTTDREPNDANYLRAIKSIFYYP